MSRSWYVHRQAYAPRTWPHMLIVSPASGALGWIGAALLGWYGMLITVPIGLAAGWYTTHWVWNRWRREHPELPPERVIDQRRRVAPFN